MEIIVAPQSRKGRLGRYMFNIVCTLVTLIGLGFILPAAFGLERYAIAGGSMGSSISRGSVVFSEVVPVSELRVGDVITYMPPADAQIPNLVTHRIVSIKDRAYRTKGDANAAADPWTFELPAGTQPRVVADVPFLGYAMLALQDRSTRMAVIGVPAGLVALYSLADLLLGLRRRKTADDVETAPVLPVLEQALPLVGPAFPAQAVSAAAGRPRPASRRPVHIPAFVDTRSG